MQLNDSPLDWKRRSALDKAGGLLLLRPYFVLLCTVQVGGRHQARWRARQRRRENLKKFDAHTIQKNINSH